MRCTLGEGPFPPVRKPTLIGYGYRYRNYDYLLPSWLGQRLIEDAIHDALVAEAASHLTPLYADEEDEEWLTRR